MITLSSFRRRKGYYFYNPEIPCTSSEKLVERVLGQFRQGERDNILRGFKSVGVQEERQKGGSLPYGRLSEREGISPIDNNLLFAIYNYTGYNRFNISLQT
jgi:hypothetical protein